MLQYYRTSPPECLENLNILSKQKKIDYYKKIVSEVGKRKIKWKITKIWNEWEKIKNIYGEEISDIRTKLLIMTNNSCAFCGKRISNDTLEVEHFLPSSEFPFIAYCWENYLPSCSTCNSRFKTTFVPEVLKTKIIVESIIVDKVNGKLIDGICSDDQKFDYIYDRNLILGNITKEGRILDCTYDKVDEHLIFRPELHSYEVVRDSSIGTITKGKLFRHSSVEERFRKISKIVRNVIKRGDDFSSLEDFIELDGYDFYYIKYYEFWNNEKLAGRIDI